MGLHRTTTWTHSFGVWLLPVPGLLLLALISKYPEIHKVRVNCALFCGGDSGSSASTKTKSSSCGDRKQMTNKINNSLLTQPSDLGTSVLDLHAQFEASQPLELMSKSIWQSTAITCYFEANYFTLNSLFCLSCC